jgi:hypothetical protein
MAPARTPYSPIQHIARSIWLGRDLSRCLVFTYYTAFYDTSGSEGDHRGMIVTVGLVSSVPRWESFDDQWRRALDFCHIPELHIREGRMPEDKLDYLAKRIEWNIDMVFVVGADLEGFRKVDTRYSLKELMGGPYAHSADICRDLARVWLEESRPLGLRTEHFFAKGDSGQEELQKLTEEDGFPIKFIPKEDGVTGEVLPAFQAADFMAWEYRRGVHDSAAGGAVRNTVMNLHKTIPAITRFYDEAAFEWLCEQFPEGYPPRTT